MSKFCQNGSTFRVYKDQDLTIFNRLPAATYTVKYNEMFDQWSLETIDSFEVKGKIYGETTSLVDRILRTFESRDNVTGVLLSGEKGCGKTMLAKLLTTKAIEQDIPAIIINECHCGESFNRFIQEIDQPCVIVFDEFEKVYDEGSQNVLLTLLDGTYPTKKLFVLTTNDQYKINRHMRNRPGRLFYNVEYNGVTADFVREYCQDNLNDKGQIESLVKYVSAFNSFNFDMLKALVEEMNRYGENVVEALKYLNIKMDEYASSFNAKLTVKGKEPGAYQGKGDETFTCKPLEGFTFWHASKKDSDGDWNGRHVHFSLNDITKIEGDSYYYEKGDIKLHLTKSYPKDVKSALDVLAL